MVLFPRVKTGEMGIERQIFRELSRTTNVFGLKLWTVITVGAVAVIFVTIVVVFWLLCSSSSSQRSPKSSSSRKKLSSGTRNTPPSCCCYAHTLLERRSRQQAERESADDPLTCISVTVSTKTGVEKKENGKEEGATMDAAAGAAKIIALATAFKLEDEHQEKKKHKNNNNGLSWTEMVSLGHRKVSGEDSMLQRQDELHRHVFLPAKQQQPQQNVAALQQVSTEGDCRLWVDAQTPRPRKQEQEQDSRRDGGGGGGEDRLSYSGSGDSNPIQPPTDLGWGQSYSLREIEIATNGFADETLLGEGGYGIVYRGELPDGTLVAVKNLLNNKGRAEKEFLVEVEAIGRVRHKNLVQLLGYCAEGTQRMLVYEYVDNGNLDQWLHGPLAETNPLTWQARMRIVLGTAKALAYLHEALEPKVVHRDIKSSNILVDTSWDAKVSDFGLAKLLGSDKSHVTTRVMGTFGYVAPEYCSTGLLNERSDVYSFGVLLTEVITGRDPVDYSRATGEVNLVDWLKQMVASKRSEEVADPQMKVKPSTRTLKRAILVALRCVDPDAQKRPKMGHVVHMLEADDFPF
ncbi:hypothetical protein BDL97_12G017600 [Sphagnum fallax]|jgi:hypothetical protein|nr:hypothetical protein BDL97_12G017600 [Sphagnum fallax]KAH8945016.1 hypothetical protein BDL97_12G017600 [Sphagnum fallax]